MKTIVITCLLIGLMTATAGSAIQNEPKPSAPDIKTEVMKLLDDYMSAWNLKDLAAWERTFQFPHYRLAGGKMSVLDRQGLQDAARVWASAGSDWHHSKWDRRRIIHSSPDKVHVDTKFTRCRVDGSVIGSFESLYILAKEGGRWGVKMRSSFAP
ncbi:MAG: hypothetical protein AABN33_01305 [Acidobacteriota bacterium]